MVGQVPPFLPFFMAALEEYGLLVHPTPNAVVTLALFAHACEAFVGVSPSVALFCHFFSVVRSSSLSPGPGVVLQNHSVGPDFFPLSRKCKWDNWERR